MKFSALFAVASAAVVASLALPQEQPAPAPPVPDCVNTCIVPPMWQTDCSLGGDDFNPETYMACVCADENLKKGARECLPATCTREEIPAALDIINLSCGEQPGYPVTEEQLFPAGA